MTGWVHTISRSRRLLEAALWGAAGLVAFIAHAGALIWATSEPPVTIADPAPPPAIMIEMAAEPQAVNTDMNQIVDRTKDVTEAVSEAMQRVQEKVDPVGQTMELPPDQETVEPPAEVTLPIEQVTTVKLARIELPLRATKSQPQKRTAEKKQPKKQKRQEQQQASETSFAASAQIEQSERNAARQTVASFGFGSASPAEWQSRLMAHLERRKRYPPAAREKGETGIVFVRFRIDDAGNVLSVALARSSGFSELDGEVLSLVQRASPVPAPPPGANKLITAPVRFSSR
ncbi:energy transducer TonB [Bradyrhizobium sp. ARR65]|uniref:energy transducer TonB n=1 Tax=Bradyrhizobium sp. ARR65 TaxID=1040989 RepID=UPI000466C08F|nr:energy transducer TonB [Bradyrhizobium sp. ARR65]